MGKKANKGQEFEKKILDESEIIYGVNCRRIPNEVKRLYSGSPVQVKTCFDFCASVDGVSVHFDAKSTANESLNFKSYIISKEKKHQYLNLLKSYDDGSVAGYLIWWYKLGLYSWASVQVIKSMIDSGEKFIKHDSPGVITTDDTQPINLRELCYVDVEEIIGKWGK